MTHGAFHDFAHRLWQEPDLRAEFARDPAAVLAASALSEEEKRLLLDGSFPALAELGMHPLVQMPYSLARNPQVADQISFRDYLDHLD